MLERQEGPSPGPPGCWPCPQLGVRLLALGMRTGGRHSCGSVLCGHRRLLQRSRLTGSPWTSGQLGGAVEPDPQRSECPGEEFCSRAGNAHCQTGRDGRGLRGGAWDSPPPTQGGAAASSPHQGHSPAQALATSPLCVCPRRVWAPRAAQSGPHQPRGPQNRGQVCGPSGLAAWRPSPLCGAGCAVDKVPIQSGPAPGCPSGPQRPPLPRLASTARCLPDPLPAPKLPLVTLSPQHLSCSKGPAPQAVLRALPGRPTGPSLSRHPRCGPTPRLSPSRRALRCLQPGPGHLPRQPAAPAPSVGCHHGARGAPPVPAADSTSTAPPQAQAQPVTSCAQSRACHKEELLAGCMPFCRQSPSMGPAGPRSPWSWANPWNVPWCSFCLATTPAL